MDCAICLDKISPEDLFQPHKKHNHVFHFDCILTWTSLRREQWDICPYCSEPINSLDYMKPSPIYCLTDACWSSGSAHYINLALQASFKGKHARLRMLKDLLRAEKYGAFEFLWSTLEHSCLTSEDYFEIAIFSSFYSEIPLTEYLIVKGYINHYDMSSTFLLRTYLAENKDLVKFCLDCGFHGLYGPQNESPHKTQEISSICLVERVTSNNDAQLLAMLIDTGYELSPPILAKAISKKSWSCYELILKSGYDVCQKNCLELRMCESYGVETVKYFIENGGCSHRNTWKRWQDQAFLNKENELYDYCCSLLGNETTLPPEIQFANAVIDNDVALVDKAINEDNLDFKSLFPCDFIKVSSIDMYDLLVESGYSVKPSKDLFASIVSSNRPELIRRIVREGLVIDQSLFTNSVRHFRFESTIVPFLKMFRRRNIDIYSNLDLWKGLIKHKNMNDLMFLIKTADKESLFRSYDVIEELFNAELVDIIYYLVKIGLPKDCNDNMLVKLYFNLRDTPKAYKPVDYFKFFYETQPALLFDLDFYLANTYFDDDDIMEYVAMHYINPAQLTEAQIVKIESSYNSWELKNRLDELPSLGRTIPYHKVEQSLIDQDYVDNLRPLYENHPEIEMKPQSLFEQAASKNLSSIAYWMISEHSKSISANRKVLESVANLTEDCRYLSFYVAQQHLRSCDRCSDLKSRLVRSNPHNLVKKMVERHQSD